MKKLLILVMVLALGLAVGCSCKYTAPDGTVSESFANCFKIGQDKVCNADPAVIATADAVLSILKPIAGTLIPGSAPYLALITAQGIKDTGCATITGLNTLIAFIEGFNKGKTLTMAGLKAASAPINVQPLYDWKARK